MLILRPSIIVPQIAKSAVPWVAKMHEGKGNILWKYLLEMWQYTWRSQKGGQTQRLCIDSRESILHNFRVEFLFWLEDGGKLGLLHPFTTLWSIQCDPLFRMGDDSHATFFCCRTSTASDWYIYYSLCHSVSIASVEYLRIDNNIITKSKGKL